MSLNIPKNPNFENNLKDFGQKTRKDLLKITDIGLNIFLKIYPEFSENIKENIYNGDLADFLCKNVSQEKLTEILKNKLVHSNIKLEIIKKLQELGKNLDENFLDNIICNNIKKEISQNGVKRYFSKNSYTEIFVFKNDFVKIGEIEKISQITKNCKYSDNKPEFYYSFKDKTKYNQYGAQIFS